eukprot:TRINITY_DN1772_c0_g1_i2.p1 TRINITY_DN1772_c0_g1~~TRINITY_DN1772_c0_g1_i2.p1  ORF type:complete len:537 (-),score=127.39 TRINITY_DN1772_c0_g1_i2:1144-2754(-)
MASATEQDRLQRILPRQSLPGGSAPLPHQQALHNQASSFSSQTLAFVLPQQYHDALQMPSPLLHPQQQQQSKESSPLGGSPEPSLQQRLLQEPMSGMQGEQGDYGAMGAMSGSAQLVSRVPNQQNSMPLLGVNGQQLPQLPEQQLLLEATRRRERLVLLQQFQQQRMQQQQEAPLRISKHQLQRLLLQKHPADGHTLAADAVQSPAGYRQAISRTSSAVADPAPLLPMSDLDVLPSLGGPPEAIGADAVTSDDLPDRHTSSELLTAFMQQQRDRPEDNNIEFWRKFVARFFAKGARKRWCVSSYGVGGRQPAGVFPQDVWHCELCGADPGRGFEMTREVLPRLFKIKYDSGVLDELLFVGEPSADYEGPPEGSPSGRMRVLEFGRVVQESVFEGLRVIRSGKLRLKVTFGPAEDEGTRGNSLAQIAGWELCTQKHEEVIPRQAVLQQVSTLANLAFKYTNNDNANNPNGLGPKNLQAASALQQQPWSIQQLQSQCTAFASAAQQLALRVDMPAVNDLGFNKCYVRCLQDAMSGRGC